MFIKGDMVVYGQTGVCRVEDLCEKEIIKNKKCMYYVLKPIWNNNNTIYAPVGSEKVFIRKVISKQEAEDFINRIPEIAEKDCVWEDTKEGYRNSLSNYKLDDLIKMTSLIYRKRKNALENKKRLGFVDEKYMSLAEGLLFGELACALGIPLEEVKNYISEKLKSKE